MGDAQAIRQVTARPADPWQVQVGVGRFDSTKNLGDFKSDKNIYIWIIWNMESRK